MALRIYNTLTREKELFESVTPGKVGIYLCGPTVYKPCHIGHFIGPVIFDALKKYLIYKGYNVTFVVNITDVDDKMINEAQKRGITTEQLAREISAGYYEALEKLNIDSIDHFPHATSYIPHMIQLIHKLGDQDAAYVADGDVYFDVTKCDNYGCLSNRKQEDQLEGSRQLAGSSQKRNNADFALWKGVGPDEIGWESPWGRGRPGWHIECSVMSMDLLGETFDIHGGGMDLIFPHHENEIAQSQTASGKPYVKYWMHNGLTRVRTKSGSEWKAEKMSKSLGNIKPIAELLEEYPPAILRFFVLSTHYRRPIDFSDEAITAVQKGANNIYRLLDRLEALTGDDIYHTKPNIAAMENQAQSEPDKKFTEDVAQAQLRYLEALDDDFNTAAAIATLFELVNIVNRYLDDQRAQGQTSKDFLTIALEAGRMVTHLGQILGLFTHPLTKAAGTDSLTPQLMELIIKLRKQARTDKNFQLSDTIRDALKNLNITLRDNPDGTTEWQLES